MRKAVEFLGLVLLTLGVSRTIDHLAVRPYQAERVSQAPTYSARCSPVRVERSATRSAGVPSKTIFPPS
jgi:hypothetical protein